MINTPVSLVCNDTMAGMKQLPDRCVDVIVTSPQYNLGIKYKDGNDKKDVQDYLDQAVLWFEQWRRILKDDGSLFLNFGASCTSPMLPFHLISTLGYLGRTEGKKWKPDWYLQNHIDWVKSISVPTRKGDIITAGHFKPITSDRFLNINREDVFHLTKTGKVKLDRLAVGVPYQDKSNIERRGHAQDLRCRGNTVFIPYDTVQKVDEDSHPAPFPPELAAYCFKLHGKPEECVGFDPFVGEANAAIGARQAGLWYFFGFDHTESYLKRGARNLGVELSTMEGVLQGLRS